MDAITLEFARDIMARLEREAVPWLLAGGQALVAHGLCESRHDVDIVVQPQSVPAVLKVVRALGGRWAAGMPERISAREHMQGIVSRLTPTGWASVDLFTGMLTGWATLWDGRILLPWHGCQVWVPSLEALHDVKRRTAHRSPRHATDAALILSAIKSRV